MNEIGFHNQLRALRYIGSKVRLMVKLRPILKAQGAKFFCDVFGGSGAVVMGAGFDKRIYNDLDGDVVHFFRVLACPEKSALMFRMLRRLPMSRELFEQDNAEYVRGGKSFAALGDVERAAAFFYRSAFAFAGKMRNGGFGATVSDRNGCKEIKRYRAVLRRMGELRQFWQGTVIERLDFEECIRGYGKRDGALLFCDPPYFGTERYYSEVFSLEDHARLAAVLHEVPAKVVLTYYDTPEIRELYPESLWETIRLDAVKNSMKSGGKKETVRELVIVKRDWKSLHRTESAEQGQRAGGSCLTLFDLCRSRRDRKAVA